MRRIALALVLAALPSSSDLTAQTKELPAPAAGLWHLLDRAADEQNMSDHRVDIRLWPTPAPFRAAIVHHGTGDETPYPLATFDGRTLRLQMGAHGATPMPHNPTLQMTWDGTRFTGTYVDAAFQPMKNAVQLKLVKSRQ